MVCKYIMSNLEESVPSEKGASFFDILEYVCDCGVMKEKKLCSPLYTVEDVQSVIKTKLFVYDGLV